MNRRAAGPIYGFINTRKGGTMETFTLRKEDGNLVSCMREIPENPKAVVIAVHGFTSSKECSTFQMLRRRLPPAGYGMVGIDLPGHGTAESLRETLRIEGAKDSIAAAERYAAGLFPGLDIFYFASSFGAYLTGLYISTREHLGRKAFFRSAAVNMPSLIVKESPDETDLRNLRQLEEQGWFETNADLYAPVRITQEMYHDFETNDLFTIFDPEKYGSTRVAMVHGTLDEVIDPQAAAAFAERFSLPITFFEGEGHSLSGCPDTPDRVGDLALAFYAIP